MNISYRFSELALNAQLGLISSTGLHEDELRDGEYYFTEDSEPLLRFSDLSARAKKKARKDYLKGWLKTHPEDKDVLFDDSVVSGDDKFLFLENGKFFCEESD